jgi:lysophospholipase L1-like esterase
VPRIHLVALLTLTLITTTITAAACDGDTGATNTPAAPRASVYVSLGDSIAAGNGASSPDTRFAAIVYAESGAGAMIDLARAGATTTNVIDDQMPAIDGLLAGRDVALITVSAGGNDLASLIPNAACQEDPPPDTCPLDDALDAVEGNLRAIVDHLRQSYEDAPIVLLAYPNFFSGTGHQFDAPAARVLPRLAERIRSVASAHDNVAVADPAPAFEDRSADLTHVLDPTFDPHPNDTGHSIIADAVLAALEPLAESSMSATP